MNRSLRIMSVSAALAGILAVCVLPSSLSAQSSAPYKEVPGASKVTTSDFGPLPQEIVWGMDNSTMVLIPAGTYKIGANGIAQSGVTAAMEGPEVTVTLGSFYIDKTEVSNERYLAIAKLTGLGLPAIFGNKLLSSPDRPVVGIPWDDAALYAKKTKKDLPTEAEWEVAGRGAAANLYPWGNESREGAAVLGRGANGATEPCGSTSSDVSAFGVHDLAGNASEWTRDYYLRDYFKSVSGDKNPIVKEASETRTVRGGSFAGKTDGRLTTRFPISGGSSREEVGFRTIYRLYKPEPTPVAVVKAVTPTPTPSAKERAGAMKEILATYLANPKLEVPDALATTAGTSANVPFVNDSLQKIDLAFVDLGESKIYTIQRAALPPVSVTSLSVPANRVVDVFAFAPDSPTTVVLHLGALNSESKPLVRVTPQAWNEIIMPDGSKQPMDEKTAYRQHFKGGYQPAWHEIDVLNNTDHPVEVTAGRFINAEKIDMKRSVTLEPGQIARYNDFPGVQVQLEAKYVGGETPVSVVFPSDSTADRHAFLLEPSADNVTVPVLTTRLPKIIIQSRTALMPAALRAEFVAGGTGKK